MTLASMGRSGRHAFATGCHYFKRISAFAQLVDQRPPPIAVIVRPSDIPGRVHVFKRGTQAAKFITGLGFFKGDEDSSVQGGVTDQLGHTDTQGRCTIVEVVDLVG